MVARIHHATIAKAGKLGFIVSGEQDDEFYTVRWPERNKSFTSLNATQGVEDMKVLKMLTLEYPKLKVTQPKTGGWVISTGKRPVGGSDFSLQQAWEQAADLMDAVDEDGDEPAEDEEEGGEAEAEAEDEGRSIIKKKYKTRYKPFKMTCGDELAQQMKAHVSFKDEDGKMHVDVDKLVRFAKANGCWDPNYKDLNVGMQRLNIGNRLRGKIRRDGHAVVWSK